MLFSGRSPLLTRLRRARRSLTGIDIGTDSIKLAQVERQGTDWKLANCLTIPSVSSTAELTDALRSGALAKALSRLGNRSRSRLLNVACALPMSTIDLRTVDVPVGSEEEVQQMAMESLRDIFEEDFDDRVTKTWLHSIRDSDNMTEVSAISVRSDMVEHMAEDLHSHRLNCRILDGLPFALTRAAGMLPDHQPGQPVAIVDWGHTSVTLVIALNGKPEFIRILRGCSGSTAERLLFEGLGVLPGEARQLLATVGLPHEDDSGASAALKRTIGSLLSQWHRTFSREVQKTLTYLRHHRSRLAPGQVILTGGIAAVPNIVPHLQEACDLPIVPWSLSGNRNESLFATAIALAALGEW